MDVNEDVVQPGTAPNSYFIRALVMRICCTCMFFPLKLQTKIDWLWAVGWSCIDRWLQTKQFICPVCRKEVPRMRGGVMKRMLRMRLLFVSSQFWEGYVYIYNLYIIPTLHIWYIYIYMYTLVYLFGWVLICLHWDLFMLMERHVIY